MANKSAKRGVSIYIDGKEIPRSVKAIRKEYRKLILEQENMIEGSDEYVAQTKKIGQLGAILDRHRQQQRQIALGYNEMNRTSSKFFKSAQVFWGNIMTKGATFLVSSLGDSINKIREFEKANVVLAGILGVNRKEIKDLTATAISLGKTSKYTASQVTELQTELAKLGFEKHEIKESQRHILNFATALDANLGDAASLAGAALRAFNEDTSQTERYVSTMTIAANKSALGFGSLATAIPVVAPVANAFNFSIEDTLALLGNLSDSGFDAGSSATALRNILLNLADANGKLAKELGTPVRNLDDLVKGFKTLNDRGIDLARSLELTDKLSVAAFQTFLKGADKLVPLRDSLIDVGDELERVANDQMDNLDGAILSLQSSWEGLMLSFSNSAGPMKTVVDWVTKLVDGATNLIEKTKLLQDRNYYNEFLEDDYQHSLDVQKNIISKRKSEGYSPEMVYSIQKQRTNLDLEDKLAVLEQTKKKYDEWNNNKSWSHYLNPLNASLDKEIERAYEVAKYEVDRLEMQKKAIEDLRAADLKTEDSTTSTTKTPTPPVKEGEQRKILLNGLREIEEQHLKNITALKQLYLKDDSITEEAHNLAMLKQQDAYDAKRKEKMEQLLKSLTDSSLRLDIAKQIAEIDSKALDRQISEMEKRRKELEKWNAEEDKKIVAAALLQIDVDQKKEEQLLAVQRAKREMSDDQYRMELLKREQKYLEERLRINGLTEEEISKLRADIEINKGEQEVNNADTRTAALDKYGLVSLQTTKEQELAIIKYYEEQGILSHDEAMKAKRLIAENYLDGLIAKAEEVNSRVQMVGGNLTGAMTNFATAEENAVARKYDKQIKAAEGNAKKQAQLEEQKQKEQNEIKAKYADKQFTVQIAQVASSTTVAAMEAYKAMAGIPIIGPALGIAAATAAVAYGASQIAVAKEQRDAAKEGYYDGGFTGGVDPKQVRGYLSDGSPVHGVEFVGNHHSTANPEILPLYNVIDEAQKHGTVGSLTKHDLAKALNIPMMGYQQGGFSGNQTVVYQNAPDTRYDDSYDRFVQVVERLEDRLNERIVSEVYITGDNGLERTQNLYDKMRRNGSRSKL